LLLSLAASALGCPRVAQTETDAGVIQQTPDDAGTDGGDGPTVDDGVGSCNGFAPSPDDGGISWAAGGRASVAPPQGMGWTTLSSDPECSAMAPGAVPHQLSWSGPEPAASCDPAIVDGSGNLAVFSLSNNASAGYTFLRGDGTSAVFVSNGSHEFEIVAAPRSQGFVLLTQNFRPWCHFARLLGPDALSTSLEPLEAPDPTTVHAVIANPRGGYVLERTVADAPPHTFQSYLQVRWVDEVMKPLGDWHTVMEWTTADNENSWRILLDQQGNALVLSFEFPPSLGAPPPPSSWTFSARWMNARGPIGDAFQPIFPTYTAANGRAFFADWGNIVPLREGGFAFFHAPAPAGSGAISPSGWYASYGSGESVPTRVPPWFQSYDGSLQLLSGARGYAAEQVDSSCARAVLLIAPSCRACHKLPLADSTVCNASDTLSPDGTLLRQGFGSCSIQWWPRLAAPSTP